MPTDAAPVRAHAVERSSPGAWLHAFDLERRRQQAVEESRALTCHGDPELTRIVDLAAAHYGTAFAAVSIIDRRWQVLIAEHGLPDGGGDRSSAFCAIAIQTPDAPLVVPDARADPRLARYATVVGAPFLRFYAGVPLLDATGHVLGTVCIADRAPRAGPFDATMLTILAREVERRIQQ